MRRLKPHLFVLVFVLFLVACTNNNANVTNESKNTTPIGYYSNEKRDENNEITDILNPGDTDGRFSTTDVNYHGHLNVDNRQPNSNNYNSNESKIIKKARLAAEKVNNVDRVRSVSFGSNHVLIGITVKDKSKRKETIQEVKKAVSRELDGQSVQVVIDEGTIAR